MVLFAQCGIGDGDGNGGVGGGGSDNLTLFQSLGSRHSLKQEYPMTQSRKLNANHQ